MEWTAAGIVWIGHSVNHDNTARRFLIAPTPSPTSGDGNAVPQNFITGLNPFVTIAAFIACSVFVICLCFRVVIGQAILRRQAARDGQQRNEAFQMNLPRGYLCEVPGVFKHRYPGFDNMLPAKTWTCPPTQQDCLYQHQYQQQYRRLRYHASHQSERKAGPTPSTPESVLHSGPDSPFEMYSFFFQNFWQAPQGLPETVFHSFPSFPFSPEAMDPKHESTCSICLSEYEAGETLRQLPPCEHMFHLPCIDSWLSRNKTCPVCRNSLAPADTTDPVADISNNPIEEGGQGREVGEGSRENASGEEQLVGRHREGEGDSRV